MILLKGIYLFHKKLIIPVLSISLLLSLIGGSISTSFFFKILGISYIIFALLFHFYIYEIRNSTEYYFYHNLGLNKICLWLSTVIISLIVGIILFNI